ncbi:hypothetical protein [Bacillus sp. HMF5848]|nr:hypothetical protein [Bacillus sp. HMF5848]
MKEEKDRTLHAVTTALDSNNPLKEASQYAGESIDEHTTLEQANEFIANKEIKQVFNNQ